MKKSKKLKGIGWVYILTHTNSRGVVKIGLTRDPDQRIQQLGGVKVAIIIRLLSLDPEKTEKHLHKKFDEWRIPQSEWFNLNKEQIEDAVELLKADQQKVLALSIEPDNWEAVTPSKQIDPATAKARKAIEKVKHQMDPSSGFPKPFTSSNPPDYRWCSEAGMFVRVE